MLETALDLLFKVLVAGEIVVAVVTVTFLLAIRIHDRRQRSRSTVDAVATTVDGLFGVKAGDRAYEVMGGARRDRAPTPDSYAGKTRLP